MPKIAKNLWLTFRTFYKRFLAQKVINLIYQIQKKFNQKYNDSEVFSPNR
jgi:hypothetical protein